MMWIVEKICAFCINVFTEAVIYIFIDVIVKNLLREASDDEEKRQIWRWECGLFALMSSIIYIVHHTPYILILMSITTILYAELLGRVDFGYWWRRVATQWDDFEQHQNSMEQFAEMNKIMQQALEPVPAASRVQTQTRVTQRKASDTGYGGSSNNIDGSSSEPWYPSDPDNQTPFTVGNPVSVQNFQQSMNVMPPNVTAVPQMRARYDMQSAQQQQQQQQMGANMNMAGPGFMDRQQQSAFASRLPNLARNSIHSPSSVPTHLPSPGRRPFNQPFYGAQVSSQQIAMGSFKSKCLSALGMSPSPPQHPGLTNNGRNVCFMNCVLQCLAHVPMLASCLENECRRLHCTACEVDLLISMSNLMGRLSRVEESTQVIHQDAFREAANKLRPTLIVAPGGAQPQRQQDCAEFLLWILDALHSALNTCRPRAGENTTIDTRQRFKSSSFEQLKFIYGDLSVQNIEDAKVNCKQELITADGLTRMAYSEPLQRLTDMEWLSHKAINNSIIDDLFTGQLVESQRCVQCNKISIQIQTFNILPIAIVEPRELNGLVYLDDCFSKFGRVEELLGRNGLRCDCCNKRALNTGSDVIGASPVLSNGGATPFNRTAGTLKQTIQKRRLLRNAENPVSVLNTPQTPGVGGVSPIPSAIAGNNSHHEFRTSTPIHSSNVQYTLSDGERRSLLRQLPDCLILQLLRFSVREDGEPIKLQTPVCIPQTNLDLSPVAEQMYRNISGQQVANNQLYDLCAVCVHEGASSTQSGHYISYVRTLHCGWCKFDDERVTQVNMQYELTTRLLRDNAYLLFYKKSEVGM